MGVLLPTTELIGCLGDVLPIVVDSKDSPTGGVEIRWDGDSLHFTAYDVFSGGSVVWTPGEGAEGEIREDDESFEDYAWGGEDEPWRVFVWTADVKEIVKLFKLPAKWWRFPVTMKVNIAQTKLIIERDDIHRGERLLTVSTANDQLKHIPDVRGLADDVRGNESNLVDTVGFSGSRLGPLCTVRPHGPMTLDLGRTGDPAAVYIGSRFAGFVYPAGVQPISASRLTAS